MGVLLVSYIIVFKQSYMGVLKRLNKTGCVLLEAYMDVPKRLHMSVSTLPYVDVPTHLHTFVLERRGRSETPSDNCFYTPRIWPRHISVSTIELILIFQKYGM